MAETTLEFKISDLPQFEILADFLGDAKRLAEERGDEELTALVKRAVDGLAAAVNPGDDPQ